MEHQPAEQHDGHDHAVQPSGHSGCHLSHHDHVGHYNHRSVESGTSVRRSVDLGHGGEKLISLSLGSWMRLQHGLLPGIYYCRVVTHGYQAPFDGLQWPDSATFTLSAQRPQRKP